MKKSSISSRNRGFSNNSSASVNVKVYTKVLLEIKEHIEQAKANAFESMNVLLNKRNWIIGQTIVEKQKEYAWGTNFLDLLARDLQNIFPENSGLSIANIYRMRAFYLLYHNIRAAARILEELPMFSLPWFHNVLIMQKLKNVDECLWYAQKAVQEGWSRSYLDSQIKSKLYQREGKAISNFSRISPPINSALVQSSFKDPYVFDFIALQEEHVERDLENALIAHVEEMLLEFGKGFALVARQYHLEVGNKDYYIDLLFYHLKLKCYIVVELKFRDFDPRDAGQINFYLSAVDDLVRDAHDGPTIGLLLCKGKDNFTAEYALRDINKPIGIAQYQTEILKRLPNDLKSSLPTVKELEEELEKKELLSKKPKKMAMKRTIKKFNSVKRKISKK